jgi:hypothetical protein
MFVKNTGAYNVALGFFSLTNHISGSSNTAIGENAMFNDTSGYQNTAVGNSAMVNNKNARYSTAIGYQSMNSHRTNDGNSSAGAFALDQDTSGVYNTALGHQAMYWNYNGGENAVIGVNAMMNCLTGYQNTAIGSQAMTSNNSGYGNTGFGYACMQLSVSGNYNTAIGDSTIVATSSLNNTAVLGARAMVSAGNTISFGSATVNRWVFARSSAASGVLQVGYNNTNGNGAYLSAGGVWTDISDRSAKEGIEKMNAQSVLTSVAALPVTQWKYKGTANEFHIGPMARDFQQAFNIGDGASLSAMDKTGVALLSIQALQEENELLKKMIDVLEQKIGKLEKEKSK